MQDLWANPPSKSGENPMYKINSAFDFRFANLIVAVGGDTDGKIVKL